MSQALSICGYSEWAVMSGPKKEDHTTTTSTSTTKGSIILPYVGPVSERLRKSFRSRGIEVHLKPINSICSLLVTPKDPTPDKDKCDVVYQVDCNECNAFYIGETGHALSCRMREQ